MIQQNKYSNFERWLLSLNGRRILNRLYSWGAALVILGALFKFLEWPYANLILFVSLSMEIIVFIISGFEPQDEDIVHNESLHPHSPTSNEISTKAYTEEMERLAHSVNELREEHQRMLRNLAELNNVYQRMLDAMTKHSPEQHKAEK